MSNSKDMTNNPMELMAKLLYAVKKSTEGRGGARLDYRKNLEGQSLSKWAAKRQRNTTGQRNTTDVSQFNQEDVSAGATAMRSIAAIVAPLYGLPVPEVGEYSTSSSTESDSSTSSTSWDMSSSSSD